MSLTHYLSHKLSIRKFRLSDHIPYRKRISQAFSHHRIYRADQLPSKVDLRPDMTPIENQLNIGTSVVNCLAGAYEYLTKKSCGKNVDISRLFIYYNARVKGTEFISDCGCTMLDAIEALEEFGTCLESIWPYDISYVNERPSDEAYEQAENHKIHKALRINLDLDEMKSCLAQGFPFAFCLKLCKSFDKAATCGIVPIPELWEQEQQSSGSHALLAVGYSDRSKAFIIRNSWGEKWGDKGYCYIPYEYMTNSDLCFDIWTIRKLANDDFGQDHWHCNDLVDYLDDSFEIDPTNEEYSLDNERKFSWRDYYNRQTVVDESWNNQYRNYQARDEDYFDDYYRRNRSDRENDSYNQRFEGYVNYNRNFSYPFYDQYQDERNQYHDQDYDRHYDNHRKSTH